MSDAAIFMATVLYVYVDSTRDGRPFYVGKGNCGRVRKIRRNRVHTNITKKYGLVRRIVFETMHEPWVFEREIELIAMLKTRHGIPGNWGANLSAGGEGLSNPSPETRQKLSVAQKRRIISVELRQRMSMPNRGKRRTDEQRARMSASHINRKPVSDVTRQKLSESHKGLLRTDEHRSNLSLSQQGRVFSEEHRQKLREAWARRKQNHV